MVWFVSVMYLLSGEEFGHLICRLNFREHFIHILLFQLLNVIRNAQCHGCWTLSLSIYWDGCNKWKSGWEQLTAVIWLSNVVKKDSFFSKKADAWWLYRNLLPLKPLKHFSKKNNHFLSNWYIQVYALGTLQTLYSVVKLFRLRHCLQLMAVDLGFILSKKCKLRLKTFIRITVLVILAFRLPTLHCQSERGHWRESSAVIGIAKCTSRYRPTRWLSIMIYHDTQKIFRTFKNP